MLIFNHNISTAYAEVMEQEDIRDLKSCAYGVRVQIPSSAPARYLTYYFKALGNKDYVNGVYDKRS